MSRARVALLCAALLAGGAAAGDGIPLEARRSGHAFMGSATQAMQDDEATNPGTLWVLEGEALWSRRAGAADKACADCHGDARASMAGVAARHPAFDAALGRPLTLEARINACRSGRQQATPLAPESPDLLALETFVARQSRGYPIAPEADPRAAPFVEAGREAFVLRRGQLNLSCAQCHDARWGEKLGGSVIPQGHPTGYPLYRLEWQGVGSLARRLRSCLAGVRAELPARDAPAYVALEMYLKQRARGMPMDAPAVRP